MNEESAERFFEQAKNYANQLLEEFWAELERVLSFLERNKKLTKLQKELDLTIGIFSGQNIPPFLLSEEGLKKRMVVSLDEDIAEDSSFKEWYGIYKTILAEHKEFIESLSKYEDLVHRSDVHYQESWYLENNKSLFYYPSKDLPDLSLMEFTYVVYIVVLTFGLFHKGKAEYLKKSLEAMSFQVSGTGLNCKKTREEKVDLYRICLREKCIDPETLEQNFVAAFSPDVLPVNFKPVKWVLQNQKGQRHQEALGALLDVAGSKPFNRKIIEKVFFDYDGDSFQLGKLKKTDFSFKRWKEIFKG